MNPDWIGLVSITLILLLGFYFFTISRNKKTGKANQEIIYPLRLQAYERMVLFLDRIKPVNLLTSIPLEGLSAMDLQSSVLQKIKSELDYNASQQLYIEDDIWEKILLTAHTTSGALVHGIAQYPEYTKTTDIIKELIKNQDELCASMISETILAIKNEVKKNF